MYNDIYNKEQFAYERNTLLKWLTLSINDKKPDCFFHKNGFQKIVIYGVRGFGELFYNQIRKSTIEIVCFADRDYANYPAGIDGIAVRSLTGLQTTDFDVVVVTPTFYFNDILTDLTNNKIDLNKIVSLNMVVSY
ncbi:MAG: hypothetical protein J7L96_02580 [Bacteroidales bacterium]|nr:hypothetical protein [Bacteroidales bacterium]